LHAIGGSRVAINRITSGEESNHTLDSIFADHREVKQIRSLARDANTLSPAAS